MLPHELISWNRSWEKSAISPASTLKWKRARSFPLRVRAPLQALRPAPASFLVRFLAQHLAPPPFLALRPVQNRAPAFFPVLLPASVSLQALTLPSALCQRLAVEMVSTIVPRPMNAASTYCPHARHADASGLVRFVAWIVAHLTDAEATLLSDRQMLCGIVLSV